MRLIGSVNSEREARNLAAWLTAEGVDTHVEPDEKGFEIWIRHEDQLRQAREELNRFQANPDDPRYSQAHSRAAEIERERNRRQKNYAKNVVHGPRRTAATHSSPLTILLIAISGVVALMTNFGEVPTDKLVRNKAYQAMAFGFTEGDAAKKILAENNDRPDAIPVRLASIWRGEVWRLLTPMFIHFGTMHIIFNMVMLFQLGRMVEIRFGTVWLGAIVLLAAAFSNLAQGLVPQSLQGSPPALFGDMMITLFGGMSGVVYGLFGFIWIKSVIDPPSRMFVTPSTVVIMIGWMLLCMSPFADTLGLRVANWAHGVGLVTGMAIAWVATMLFQRGKVQ